VCCRCCWRLFWTTVPEDTGITYAGDVRNVPALRRLSNGRWQVTTGKGWKDASYTSADAC
jgi:hypothetical protein